MTGLFSTSVVLAPAWALRLPDSAASALQLHQLGCELSQAGISTSDARRSPVVRFLSGHQTDGFELLLGVREPA